MWEGSGKESETDEAAAISGFGDVPSRCHHPSLEISGLAHTWHPNLAFRLLLLLFPSPLFSFFFSFGSVLWYPTYEKQMRRSSQ